jgi:hypothetical protein
MGQSARLLADDPDKSGIALALLFKVGALGRCDLCGETAVVKTDYEELDNLVAVVQKAYPNALKANFHNDPIVMRDYIVSEYVDASFQCEDCNEKMVAE